MLKYLRSNYFVLGHLQLVGIVVRCCSSPGPSSSFWWRIRDNILSCKYWSKKKSKEEQEQSDEDDNNFTAWFLYKRQDGIGTSLIGLFTIVERHSKRRQDFHGMVQLLSSLDLSRERSLDRSLDLSRERSLDLALPVLCNSLALLNSTCNNNANAT